MEKSWLYRLFGWGRLPKKMRPLLEEEGIVLLDEGLGGWATLRKYRAPGRRHGFKRSYFCGSVVITRLRLAAFAYSRPLVNLPLDHPKMKDLEMVMDSKERLVIAFDAGLFDETASGKVEFCFATPQARLFLHRLGRKVVSRL